MVRKIIVKYSWLGRIKEMGGKQKGWDYFNDFLTLN